MRNDFEPGDAWLNLKITLNGSATARKANYWLAYNVVKRRFANRKDLILMQEHQPELFKQLQELIHTVNWNDYC